MKILGILFIIIGVLCAFGGFANNKESDYERIYKGMADSAREYRQNAGALDSLIRSSGGVSAYNSLEADRDVAESSASYMRHREKREDKVKWFFIAAVGFVVIRLILAVIPSPQKVR